MCLGEIGQVRRVRPDGVLEVALPRGVRAVSPLTVAEPVTVGAWVLTHSGFVVDLLSESEAREALAVRGRPEGGVR